jgi:hypothetical protein
VSCLNGWRAMFDPYYYPYINQNTVSKFIRLGLKQVENFFWHTMDVITLNFLVMET